MVYTCLSTAPLPKAFYISGNIIYQMETIFTIKEQRVLEVLVTYPSRLFSIREIARLLRISHPTVSAALRKLNRLGLAKRQLRKALSGIGGDVLWRANQEGEKYRLWKKIINLQRIYASGLVEAIATATSPDAIVLFGSYARGEDTEESDIDLFVVSSEHPIDLRRFEKTLHHKINITFESDISKLRKELLNNIINGTVIYGYLEVIR